MIVKFGKEELQLENVTSETTLADIVKQILDKTELEAESIKLIAAGKNLLANGLDGTIGSLPKGIVVLMGTKKSLMEQLSHCPPCSQTRRVINDLADAPNNTTYNSNNSSQITVQSEYRFNSIVTLPGLPFESKARAILTGTGWNNRIHRNTNE